MSISRPDLEIAIVSPSLHALVHFDWQASKAGNAVLDSCLMGVFMDLAFDGEASLASLEVRGER